MAGLERDSLARAAKYAVEVVDKREQAAAARRTEQERKEMEVKARAVGIAEALKEIIGDPQRLVVVRAVREVRVWKKRAWSLGVSESGRVVARGSRGAGGQEKEWDPIKGVSPRILIDTDWYAASDSFLGSSEERWANEAVKEVVLQAATCGFDGKQANAVVDGRIAVFGKLRR